MNLIAKRRIAAPVLLTNLLACVSAFADYEPPSNVPLEDIVAASNDLLNRPDIPLRFRL